MNPLFRSNTWKPRQVAFSVLSEIAIKVRCFSSPILAISFVKCYPFLDFKLCAHQLSMIFKQNMVQNRQNRRKNQRFCNMFDVERISPLHCPGHDEIRKAFTKAQTNCMETGKNFQTLIIS